MKTDEEILQDLIEVIHFTENVSAKIHGVLDEAVVYRIVKEKFAESKRYTVSILLLTEDGSKIKIVETSLSPEKWNMGEKVTGLRLKEFEIDLNKSSIYSQVIRKGKTVEVNVSDTIGELFPRPLAYLLSKTLGYQKKKSILTPLYKRGKIIGALAMSSTDLSQYLIPSVRNLAQHISNTLELAYEINEREKEVKEALTKSENLLSSIIEQSPFSTWIADANGTNIRQNAACRKLFGIDCDEQTVGKYNIFTDPVIKKQGFMEEVKKVFEKGETVRFTVDYDFSKVKTVNVPHATHRFLDATIFPIKDEKGKVINAVVQHEDITERKKAEGEKNKLLKAIEIGKEAVNITSPDTIMIYTNDAMDKLFGYKKGELIGKCASVLNAGPTPEAVAKRIADAVEKKGFWEGEIRNKRKDGTEFISYVRISVLRDKQGKIINFVCTQHDITERKKAEKEIKNLAKFPSENPAPVIRIAMNGTVLYSNMASSSLLKDWGCEIDKCVPDKWRQLVVDTLESGLKRNIEIEHRGKILLFEVIPVIDANYVNLYGCDITERKKMEEEKEKLQAQLVQSAKMAAVGTLASGITHGFSNLLQIMVGHVAFAQRTKKREDMKHALNIILDTSDRAAKIIKDLLTFSKPELSEKELCDITEAIESVLSLAEEQLKKHNIKVVRKYERTPAIEVNKTEMQQVFLVIVINARDAMLPKGGKLEICVKQVKENIEVRFSDTGKGIEKENLSKVFEPFYTTKGTLGGSTVPGIGLGLSVSYGIIQRHRGTIEVNSQVG
ncbi:PAS domain S-box protein, partial [bacterium]|nr:PAS domain S-box protein [bacterium]